MPASSRKPAGLSAPAKRRPGRNSRKRLVRKGAGGADAYHHGALREALLAAAEKLLTRDGVPGLTLRAIARQAGVSHAAPKHHFGDSAGLLSELAVIGFERFHGFLTVGLRDGLSAREKLDAIGRGYVAFAAAYPALFLVMFRSERLDMKRPALRAASRAALEVLARALEPGSDAMLEERLSLAQAARLAGAWSLVHGFSILLIDGRWKALLARLPDGADAGALFEAVVAESNASGGAR